VFDLCIYLNVGAYVLGKGNQRRRKIERLADEYKLFTSSFKLEKELWNNSKQYKINSL
jgi:hypothetical protein